jgi:hypothetical protein
MPTSIQANDFSKDVKQSNRDQRDNDGRFTVKLGLNVDQYPQAAND